MSGLQPNFWKIAKEIQNISGALAWFPADAPFVHLTSGNVDTWYDIAQRYTLTDQGVAGNRPAWDGSNPQAPFLNFAGAQVLYGAPNILNAKGDATIIAVGQAVASIATDNFLVAYNPVPNAPGNRLVFESSVPSLANRPGNFVGLASGVFNAWTDTAALDTTARHVIVMRAVYADGVGAAKTFRIDGVDQAGTASGGSVVGGTFGAYSLAVGGAGEGAFFAKWKLSDVLIAPYLDNARADYVQQCFKTLRGTP